jgi:hypothetical protein
MKHLERVFSELTEAEQQKIELHARRRGCSRLEYLGELIEKDMAEQSQQIRHTAKYYRFAREEDFSLKTFMDWLRARHE